MGPNDIHRPAGAKRPSYTSRRIRLASAVIAAADLLIAAWGLLPLFYPEVLVPGFEQYTGVNWAALTQESPEIRQFLLLAFRLVGALNVAAAIPLIAIALTAHRARERWAWWTLLVGNTVALGAPMAYDQLTGAIGVFEVGEWVVLGRCTRRWPSHGAVEARGLAAPTAHRRARCSDRPIVSRRHLAAA